MAPNGFRYRPSLTALSAIHALNDQMFIASPRMVLGGWTRLRRIPL
jgi:hypothetical protein